MENPNKPSKMSLDGNLSVNWAKFKKNLEIYFKASTMGEIKGDVKAAILKNLIGDEALDLIETALDLKDSEMEEYDAIINALDKYCKPRANILYARDKFYHRKQMSGEPFENFYRDLKKLVTPCEFGLQEKAMLRDRIVFGVCDQELKEFYIKQEDPSLEEVHKKAMITEETRVITKEVMSHVNEVNKKPDVRHQMQKTTNKSVNVRYGNVNRSVSNQHNSDIPRGNNFSAVQEINCNRCKKRHRIRECPAFGKKCKRCGTIGHFMIACRKLVKGLNQVSTMDSVVDTDEVFYVASVEANGKNCWMEPIGIKNSVIQFKIDTGSEVNVLPIKFCQELDLNVNNLLVTRVRLEAYGGRAIQVLGKVSLECKNHKGKFIVEFYVVNENACAILGLKSAKLMGYVDVKSVFSLTQENFVKKYEDVFEGIGKFPEKYRIAIDQNAIPVFKPARRIPIQLRDRVNKKLKEMVEDNIIQKVEEPTNWVNNCTFVEKKDGSIRICLDPIELNKQIINESYSIPTLEELTSQLGGCKYFTVLDLKNGFWQVELEEESSKLCTFSTMFGCFRFKRLPFGLKTAPMVFQRIIKNSFEDITGVNVYMDDVLIAAATKEQHDDILVEVMSRARELNIKFNAKKLQYCVNQVKYFGHILSGQGIQPDADKVRAIKEISVPQDKKSLQGILGMINYLRAYIPNLSELTSPLSALLKKDVEFTWLDIHTNILNKIKKVISGQPVLGHFDANKPVKIQTDASQNGLGSCLLQGNQPISYASRALTDTEKRYAQIEKELLAIVYACRKFHHYVYGRSVVVETDHQPLVSIFKKDINNIFCARIQIMRMKLLKYSIQLVYVPGKYMFVADLLSRNFNKDQVEFEEELFATEVVHSINLSPSKLGIFVEETGKDDVLAELIDKCVNGWPKSKTKVEEKLKRYWKLRNEIYVENGVLFFNDRIIVPSVLRNEMLTLLHEGHFGITKTIARAKTVLYWVGMNSDIENLIMKCGICEKFRASNRKETLISHEIPERPFEKVAVDIAQFGNKYYLVLFDYFSKWLEIRQMNSTSAGDTIRVLESIFSVHGIPKVFISDNMPFASWEFKKFCDDNNVQAKTSSPRYPKSNGMAEKGVHIAKQMLKKCSESGTPLWRVLLEYRDTPLAELRLSPAQILMNRRLRTRIPIKSSLLNSQNAVEVKASLGRRQNKVSTYYDRNAHSRVGFEQGDDIVYQEGGKDRNWKPGRILGKADTPRSYLLMNENGNRIRRNSFHLRRSFNRCAVKRQLEQEGGSNNFSEESRTGVRPEMHVSPEVRKTRLGREIKIPQRFNEFCME